VRVICEKYRLRGEANIPSRVSDEGHLSVLETRKYFPQITLTNRIYLFNSTDYLTASKTVALKQIQNFIPPRSFDLQDFYQSTKTGKTWSFQRSVFLEQNQKYNKSRFCFNIQHVKKIMKINLKYIHFNDLKHNGWHFTLALVERRNPSNSNYIRVVINYLMKGFSTSGVFAYTTVVFATVFA
jgi:hypothetical protein